MYKLIILYYFLKFAVPIFAARYQFIPTTSSYALGFIIMILNFDRTHTKTVRERIQIQFRI